MPAETALESVPELTDAAVGKLLAGEGVRGPRTFRGRELAAYTAGLRDLVMKVVRAEDTADLHDVVVIYVLSEAHALTPVASLARRRALISATDDVEGFRAKVSLELMDTLSDAELREVRAIVNGILKPVETAQVAIVAEVGKKKASAKGKASPTTTHS